MYCRSVVVSPLLKNNTLPCVVSCAKYHEDATTFQGVTVNKIKDANLSALKRGTGGRSSFNGIVATIFGPTGLVGPFLTNRLGKYGTQMILPYRGAFHEVLQLKVLADLGQILYTPFFLNDEDSIKRAVEYSNVVINLIGRDWKTWNYNYYDVHVTGARTIARACRQMGVQKLIHFSALNCAEHPKPVIIKNGSEFLRTKWLGEQAVREEYPEAVIFRPADIWGEEDRFLRYYGQIFRHVLHTLYMWNHGEGVYKQPVAVDDVVSGIVEAIRDPNSVGKIYQCVGPHRYHLKDFIRWYMKVLRREGHYGQTYKDAQYSLIFWLYLSFFDKNFFTGPTRSYMCWDRFEREHTTDYVDPDLPTLEDLGVKLTRLEDVIVSLVYWYRAFTYYEEEPHEFLDPPNPPIVNKL